MSMLPPLAMVIATPLIMVIATPSTLPIIGTLIAEKTFTISASLRPRLRSVLSLGR
jgi:hypothetical protein